MTHLSKMPSQLTIWLIIAGFAYVYGNQCNSTNVQSCYEDLVYYETLIFPLYGHNEAKLDDNCGNINLSVNCIRSYIEQCHESDTCDENCEALIKAMASFMKVTGLMKLADELCRKESVLRETYLDNVDCLEENADRYAGCHNLSQKSQHYMQNKGFSSPEATCCYLSWYRDCFTNATRDSCGTNATVFVSYGVHTLLSYISDALCEKIPISCASPPLPSDGSDYEMDKDGDLDEDKHDETDNEIDNSIDESGNTASTIKAYTATLIVLPYVFTMLFKYLL